MTDSSSRQVQSPGWQASCGASVFWVSTDAGIARARQLAEEGRFREAEALLRAGGPAGDTETDRAQAEGIEILRRIRLDYSLDARTLLQKLRPRLPNVTASDLERWRQAGQVQHRMIDGQPCYFRREPANLWRFCAEAWQSRDARGADGASGESTREPAERAAHVRDVIAAAERTGQAEVLRVRHTVRYRLNVHPDRPGGKAGALVRCWLPFPHVYGRQREVELIGTCPEAHVMAAEAPVNDCRRAGLQRSIYLEQRLSRPSEPLTFEARYRFVTSAYYPAIDAEQAIAAPTCCRDTCLAERPPHIVFTDELRRLVDHVTGGERNPLRKARRLFDWVHANIRYCAEQEYTTIPSFTRWALERQKGDCGIQVMLFTAMCRCSGIPARWQSGWVTFPGLANMHDWGEIRVAPWGWLPVDVSFGLTASDDPRVRAFYFGHLDAYRMIVNLDYGSPLDPPKRSLRSEPADFQRGEVEMDGRNLYFDEWDWDFDCDVEPLG